MRLTPRFFRRFWGGVAGWPRGGVPRRGPKAPATRYLLQLPGMVPDFSVDDSGHVYLCARRATESPS